MKFFCTWDIGVQLTGKVPRDHRAVHVKTTRSPFCPEVPVKCIDKRESTKIPQMLHIHTIVKRWLTWHFSHKPEILKGHLLEIFWKGWIYLPRKHNILTWTSSISRMYGYYFSQLPGSKNWAKPDCLWCEGAEMRRKVQGSTQPRTSSFPKMTWV